MFLNSGLKGFVYNYTSILRNLTCSLKNQSWIIFFSRMVSNTERVWNSIWRNVITRAKQMSSKILSVSEKTRRQFLQQKIPYRDSSRVGSSLEKSSIFQAIFYYWRQSIWRRKHISEKPQQERSNSSNSAQATSDKGSCCQTLRRRWACWHWLTPTTQTAANSLVFYQSVPWKTRSWKPAALKEVHARRERNTKWWKIFGNEQRAWSSVGDQKPSRWPRRQRRRVKRQNIRKAWLKTLPIETHREIPVTSESRVQQSIPETTKPVQIV